MNSSYTESSTITRLVAVQRWPVEPKAPCTIPPRALSMSASSSTMTAFLPPISAWTFLRRLAPLAYRSVPISVDPVNEIPLTPRVLHQGIAHLPSGTGDQVEHPRRQPCLLEHLGQLDRAQRESTKPA